MKTPPLNSTLASLQSLLGQAVQEGKQTPETIMAKATAAQFPHPELAAQVFKTLASNRNINLAAGPSAEDISDAFVALLMDPKAVEALGAGKGRDVWMNVRLALQSTGVKMGTSLAQIYETCRQTGLGYTPTILDLASQLRGLFKDLTAAGHEGSVEQLMLLGKSLGLSQWQIRLALVWMRRRKKEAGQLPTDADLEEIFADAELLKELKEMQGPWQIYEKQGEALSMLRHFGESLIDLAQVVDDDS
jgi:hypothetical protein